MFTVETASHSQGLGSDRLRKAIERNRAKQAKRDTIQMSRQSPNTQSSWTSGTSATGPTIAQDADQVRFSSQMRQGPRKPPAPVSYSKRSTALVKAKPRTKTKSPKRRSNLSKPLNVNDTVVKVFWAVCGVLVLRLIFSGGGVMDYYERKSQLNERVYEKERIVAENEALRGEIEMIKNSSAHQKKLVREHLGFISSDEFLILFAKDSKAPELAGAPRS